MARHAHAPYSKFRVGAVVLGASGRIYAGANVENASLGLALCAERSALAAASSAGEAGIVAICIACIDAPDTAGLEQKVPCGACRQWIQELASRADILVAGDDRVFTIQDLLPNPFFLKRL